MVMVSKSVGGLEGLPDIRKPTAAWPLLLLCSLLAPSDGLRPGSAAVLSDEKQNGCDRCGQAERADDRSGVRSAQAIWPARCSSKPTTNAERRTNGTCLMQTSRLSTSAKSPTSDPVQSFAATTSHA
jgi:hypothetical protein